MKNEKPTGAHDDGEIRAYVEGEDVVIRVPISILTHSQAFRPDCPFKILDEEEMAKYFVDDFIHFKYGGGFRPLSNFQQVIDDFFMNAAENAVPWIYDGEEYTGGY